MSFTWLAAKPANTTSPPAWRWPRRRRRVSVDVEEVIARAEDAMSIAERLGPVIDPRVTGEVVALHDLARDLLRWTR